jgi:hypothetical protein
MSAISGDNGSLTGAPLTAQEQIDAGLFAAPGSLSTSQTAQESSDAVLLGGSGSGSTDQTSAESADATLLDVTPGASGSVASDLDAGVPPDLTAASALVANLATQIGQQGTQASAVYSLLSADATLKLTK